MPEQAKVVVTNTTPLIALSNLNVTGSIGILLKAKSMGYPLSIPEAINRMRERGIWLSQEVIRFALER